MPNIAEDGLRHCTLTYTAQTADLRPFKNIWGKVDSKTVYMQAVFGVYRSPFCLILRIELCWRLCFYVSEQRSKQSKCRNKIKCVRTFFLLVSNIHKSRKVEENLQQKLCVFTSYARTWWLLSHMFSTSGCGCITWECRRVSFPVPL